MKSETSYLGAGCHAQLKVLNEEFVFSEPEND